MIILVTGVAGFIGANLAEYLLDNGYDVVGVDNFNEYYSPKVKEFNITSFFNNPRFKLYRIDITDRDALEGVFKENKIDAIVHLAAWAGVTYSVKNPSIYVSTNVGGTNNLAEFGAKHGVANFIFASTSSIYGDTKQTPFKEDFDTSRPLAPYPATKKAGEVLLYTYCRNFGLNVTIFRIFNPIGPKLRPDIALPKLIRCARYGKVFDLYQDPEDSSRDYTYIGHMLEAVDFVIQNPPPYEIINLGNSNPIKLFEMIDIVREITGGEIKTTKAPRPGQMKITCADVSKAKKLINYNPTTSLDKMVKIYYDWFKEQPDWYQKGEY